MKSYDWWAWWIGLKPLIYPQDRRAIIQPLVLIIIRLNFVCLKCQACLFREASTHIHGLFTNWTRCHGAYLDDVRLDAWPVAFKRWTASYHMWGCAKIIRVSIAVQSGWLFNRSRVNDNLMRGWVPYSLPKHPADIARYSRHTEEIHCQYSIDRYSDWWCETKVQYGLQENVDTNWAMCGTAWAWANEDEKQALYVSISDQCPFGQTKPPGVINCIVLYWSLP